MKKLWLGVVLAGIVSGPAFSLDEYVHRVWTNGKCLAVVTQVYPHIKEAETKTFTCSEWDAVLRTRQEAYRALLEKQRQENAAQQAATARAQQQQSEREALLEERMALNRELKIVPGAFDQISEINGQNKNYPDRIAAGLNAISKEYSSVNKLENLFFRASKAKYFEAAYPFEVSLFGALLKLRQMGYGTAQIHEWKFKMMTDKCGQKTPVFFTTIEHGKKKLEFGFYQSGSGDGYVSAQTLIEKKLPGACSFRQA